jgi:phospholipid/cholesterol/gamma-HCH transport system substrate-binding protein
MSRVVRLGIFVFAALLFFAAGIFLIGRNEFIFSSTYKLNSVFDNVGGLPNGAEVRVGGVHVGTVDRVQLPRDPHGKVAVVMLLKKSTRDVVRKDSVASILTEGLLGNKYVSVSFGSKNAPPVSDGDTISGQPPVDLSDLIAKSGQVLDSTRATMQNVEAASNHFSSIAEKVDHGQGTIGRLVNDRSVYQNMNQTVQQAKLGATAFQEDMEALKKNWLLHGFFKNRGYMDSNEIAKNEISDLPNKPVEKKFVAPVKDLFSKPDNADLKNKKPLNQAGEFLQQNPFSQVAVAAYTGFQGEHDKNLELSRAQAMVVRQYLVQNFKIDDARVKTKGMGEDNQPGRVEILVYR